MKFMEIVIHRNEESTKYWAEILVGKLPPVTSNKVNSLPEALELAAAKLYVVSQMLALWDEVENLKNAH